MSIEIVSLWFTFIMTEDDNTSFWSDYSAGSDKGCEESIVKVLPSRIKTVDPDKSGRMNKLSAFSNIDSDMSNFIAI